LPKVIAIQKPHVPAPRSAQPVVPRPRRPPIRLLHIRQLDPPVRQERLLLRHHFFGPVPAPIIDDDRLDRPIRLRPHAPQRPRKVTRAVVSRDDDAHELGHVLRFTLHVFHFSLIPPRSDHRLAPDALRLPPPDRKLLLHPLLQHPHLIPQRKLPL